MSNMFDMTTLVTIVVAVFVLLRLRSVLGKRTGHQRPPFEPYEIDRKTREAKPSSANKDDSDSNVVSLPGRKSSKKSKAEELSPSVQAVNAYAKSGTKLNKGLMQVAEQDANFNPENFVSGAKMAYEMIVTAFADGDRKALKGLLSREVYDGFASVISDRETRGETVQSSFVGIEQAKIKSAGVVGSDAQITAEFVSQIVSATMNSDGKVVDGDPDQVGEVKDIWTFARDIRSKDPNWKLVATESDG